MKKVTLTIAMGVIMLVFSACGQIGNPGEAGTDAAGGTVNVGDSAGEGQKTQNNEAAGSANGNPSAGKSAEQSVTGKEDVLQNLAGEYEYLSDYGAGKLTIKKTSCGYDISDYESESSYRFLADSSDIESTEDNGIYIKYPEQIFSDGTAVFGYYILEYGTDEIDVYYGKSSFEEAEFLYHATKKTEQESRKASVNQQENGVQAVENADSESTAEELLDLFIKGSVDAIDPTDLTSAFSITDLNMDAEERDSYSIGEKIDIDNDGENELIINGPYGGIYLDARNNKVYEFAAVEGTALILSYTYYNGAIWIMYSSRSGAGTEFYHMEKYEGADNLVAEMNFGEEFNPNNAEAGMKYTLNGAEISYDEYTELCSKILAAQVNTN